MEKISVVSEKVNRGLNVVHSLKLRMEVFRISARTLILSPRSVCKDGGVADIFMN